MINMKKRLNLEELELRLPAIDAKNSKILLGGSDYDGAEDMDGCRFCNDLTSAKLGSAETQAHNDYGDNFDLDASIDGYNDYGDANDVDGGNSSGGTGGTGTSGINIPATLSDGFNLNNANLYINNDNTSAAFSNQFNGILSSNSVIGNLFNTATQGGPSGYALIINFGDLSGIGTGGVLGNTHSDLVSIMSQTITFDTSLISSLGMTDVEILDNAGVNHDPLTPLESLVAIIAHEAFHSYSNVGYILSRTNNSGSLIDARDWMLNNGYDPAVVNIYYNTSIIGGVETVTVNSATAIEAIEHAYMSSSSFTLVNDAIAEFQSDQAQANVIKEQLENAVNQAGSYLGSGGDGAEGQPTNEAFQSSYDNLVGELRDFILDNGWMLTP